MIFRYGDGVQANHLTKFMPVAAHLVLFPPSPSMHLPVFPLAEEPKLPVLAVVISYLSTATTDTTTEGEASKTAFASAF